MQSIKLNQRTLNAFSLSKILLCQHILSKIDTNNAYSKTPLHHLCRQLVLNTDGTELKKAPSSWLLQSTMIHIATVHYKNDDWIDIQREYLEKNIDEEFKVYAFLNGIDDRHHSKFFYTSTEPVTASNTSGSDISEHAIKLNILADIIRFSSDSDDDFLVFLDGDAFPISNISSYIRSKLKRYPIAAVQRLENGGDIQPHPCFCATTVGFWEDISGDWKNEYEWENEEGENITDVGGNLLKIFRKKKIDWYKMHRSNEKNIHRLWFGVYDDVVYHHGAGFRSMKSRSEPEYVKNDFRVRALRAAAKIPVIVPGLGSVPGVEYLQNRTFEKIGDIKRNIVSKEQRDSSMSVYKEMKLKGDSFFEQLVHS